MKDDRGFRFLVGCFVIFAVYQLYANNVLGLLNSGDSDQQVESVDIVGLAIQALVSAVDGVGYVAILLVSGLWPVVAGALESLKKAIPKKPPTDLNDLDETRVRLMVWKILEKQRQDELKKDSSDDK